MSRPRKKGSKIPFSGLNLKPEEDEQLRVMLEEHGLSMKQVLRALVRQWMKEGGGMLRYSKK